MKLVSQVGHSFSPGAGSWRRESPGEEGTWQVEGWRYVTYSRYITHVQDLPLWGGHDGTLLPIWVVLFKTALGLGSMCRALSSKTWAGILCLLALGAPPRWSLSVQPGKNGAEVSSGLAPAPHPFTPTCDSAAQTLSVAIA